jgi:hypothetical protein
MSGRKTQKKKRAAQRRTILCRDSLPWLAGQKGKLDAVVASIPEMDEVGLKEDDYVVFFRKAGRLCLEAVKDTGYCVFLQTDRKHNGWIDKAYFLADEAQKLGINMIWHKIALRVDVGKSDIFRPGYSHMLCFSKKGKIKPIMPDVIERGAVTYENAFGIEAVKMVMEFLKANGVKHITDPFVGSGTTVAIANALGLKATGLDIDRSQCKKAEKLMIAL